MYSIVVKYTDYIIKQILFLFPKHLKMVKIIKKKKKTIFY